MQVIEKLPGHVIDSLLLKKNSLRFRENVVDGNQAEAPATSSSPVKVNDDEMTFEDLPALSSPLASG